MTDSCLLYQYVRIQRVKTTLRYRPANKMLVLFSIVEQRRLTRTSETVHSRQSIHWSDPQSLDVDEDLNQSLDSLDTSALPFKGGGCADVIRTKIPRSVARMERGDRESRPSCKITKI